MSLKKIAFFALVAGNALNIALFGLVLYYGNGLL